MVYLGYTFFVILREFRNRGNKRMKTRFVHLLGEYSWRGTGMKECKWFRCTRCTHCTKNCTNLYYIILYLTLKTLSRVRNGKIGDTEIILIQN